MSLKSVLTKIAAVSALSVATLAAHAATYNFTLTGAYNASWQMSSTPTPDESDPGTAFLVYDVAGNFPTAALPLADITFYAADSGGGLGIYDYYGDADLIVADGPQLYTGTEDAPVFRLGSFVLTDYFGSGDTYTLTVTAVPEPATVALMLAGLGLVGGIAVRRRKQDEETVAA